MNKSEQVVVEAFDDSTSVLRQEVFDHAEAHVTRAQVLEAYTTLLTKGILAEDEYGTVTLSRRRLAEYDVLYPLLDAPDEDL